MQRFQVSAALGFLAKERSIRFCQMGSIPLLARCQIDQREGEEGAYAQTEQTRDAIGSRWTLPKTWRGKEIPDK